MTEPPLVPRSGHLQHTTAESGTPPEAGGVAATRDTTRAFTPGRPTSPDDCAPPSWSAQTMVGKYRILGPIGGGGMGFVYRALNPDLGCPVALKVIRGGDLASADAVRRFERECQALARFRHANIVTVHDAGQHQGQPFLVMEYLGGGSLARNLARFQCDPRAAVALIEKVARAVQQLHTEGVLHRDLKPANVLLDDDGEPRVGDFGLVKLLDSADELTGTGHCPGTAPYMAPEQTGLRSQPLGPPTDVWALGVMLYELLLGGRPFTAPERPSLFHQIVTQEPARPRALRPAIDPELEAVVLKCLEKDPAQRFATAGELADDLARWLRGEPPRTKPAGRLQRVVRAARRRPRLAALGLFGTILVLAAIVTHVVLDPDRGPRKIRDDLFAGKPVVLIPEGGKPTWSDPVVGAALMPLDDESDGFYCVQAWDKSLLALARSAPCREYRVSAKVRYLRGGPGARVGIFIGYHAVPTQHGKAHLYQLFTFSEGQDEAKLFNHGAGKDGDMNPAQLDTWLNGDRGEANPRIAHKALAHIRFRPALTKRPWRHLEVTVRADRIEAAFDQRALEPTPVAVLDRRAATMLTGLVQRNPARDGLLAAIDPAFNRAGSIGVYVDAAIAAFSEFVITPSAPP